MDEFQVNALQRAYPTIESVEATVKLPPNFVIPFGWRRDQLVDHIAQGCWSIIMALTERAMPGSFIHAVLMNDLMETFMRADDMNTLCMWSYCNFLYNHVPGGMRQDYARKFK